PRLRRALSMRLAEWEDHPIPSLSSKFCVCLRAARLAGRDVSHLAADWCNLVRKVGLMSLLVHQQPPHIGVYERFIDNVLRRVMSPAQAWEEARSHGRGLKHLEVVELALHYVVTQANT